MRVLSVWHTVYSICLSGNQVKYIISRLLWGSTIAKIASMPGFCVGFRMKNPSVLNTAWLLYLNWVLRSFLSSNVSKKFPFFFAWVRIPIFRLKTTGNYGNTKKIARSKYWNLDEKSFDKNGPYSGAAYVSKLIRTYCGIQRIVDPPLGRSGQF